MTTDTQRTDAFVAENSLLAFSEDKYELTIVHARQLERELSASQAEVERLRGLLNAHAEFLIKNGFYRESRDLMGGSWSDGFVALAKKCGINPYDQ